MGLLSYFGMLYSLDMFSQGVAFRFNRDVEARRSAVGTLMSIIILAITIPYAFKYFNVLVERQGTTITRDFQEDAWNKDGITLKVGDPNNDWNYAFRLIFSIGDQMAKSYPEDMDRIGDVQISWWKWGMNPREPEKGVQMEKESLQTSICSSDYVNAMGPGIA